jgi:hypothetical protein
VCSIGFINCAPVSTECWPFAVIHEYITFPWFSLLTKHLYNWANNVLEIVINNSANAARFDPITHLATAWLKDRLCLSMQAYRHCDFLRDSFLLVPGKRTWINVESCSNTNRLNMKRLDMIVKILWFWVTAPGEYERKRQCHYHVWCWHHTHSRVYILNAWALCCTACCIATHHTIAVQIEGGRLFPKCLWTSQSKSIQYAITKDCTQAPTHPLTAFGRVWWSTFDSHLI